MVQKKKATSEIVLFKKKEKVIFVFCLFMLYEVKQKKGRKEKTKTMPGKIMFV